MFAIQISDRNTFAEKAKALQATVDVVRSATVVPVRQPGGDVMMKPAATIDYRFKFEDPKFGPTMWTFREVVLADDNGEVLLTNNLMEMLEPPARVLIRHRSGSF